MESRFLRQLIAHQLKLRVLNIHRPTSAHGSLHKLADFLRPICDDVHLLEELDVATVLPGFIYPVSARLF